MILEVNQLTKAFGGLQAVDGLSFSIGSDEILGIIGPNGAGKTTVVNMITGFLKPDSGVIRYKNKDVSFEGPEEKSRLGISRTFQIVKPFANMTVLDNVTIGRLYGAEPINSPRRAQEEAYELLEFVGLADKENVMAFNLTFADRRKLEVARALATRPKLLLLDEVVAGLNPVEAEATIKNIRKISERGIAIAMIEHVIKAVIALSTRILVLDAGKKLAEGVPEEILNNPTVIASYLGQEE